MAKDKETTIPARDHKASFSRSRTTAKYRIRVEGPRANMFAGREVPVTMRDGSEKIVKLEELVWTGVDEQSHKPVALYTFEATPMDEEDEIPF